MPDATSFEWRSQHIGASDAPIILGLSSFMTPLELWLIKTGRYQRDDDDPTGRLEAGHRLESVILRWYSDLSGRPASLWPQDSPEWHPSYPVLSATPDAHHEPDDDGGLVELKSWHPFDAHAWEYGPPLAIQVQVQQQMLVTGSPTCTVVVMIGFERPQWWDLEADAELHELLIVRLLDWWERHIEGDEPPPPIAADAQRGTMAKLHPDDNGVVIDVDDSWVELWERHEAAATAASQARAEQNEIKAEVQDRIKGNTALRLPGGSGWTWKTEKRGRVLRRVRKVRV